MTSQTTLLPSIGRNLARRYPGIHCQVTHDTRDTYDEGECLWTVTFSAKNRDALIRCGLATAKQFEVHDTLSYCKRNRHPSSHDGFGNRVIAYPPIGEDGVFSVITYIFNGVDRRDYTKKLQTQVMRLLKPFIKGTWKAAPAVRT